MILQQLPGRETKTSASVATNFLNEIKSPRDISYAVS